jgi:hypothetical protein
MEIANLITGFTQQQSNRNAILSDNLAKYGEGIANYLANQEYQKQAQATLPLINNQMQSALKLASENKPAEAYSQILNLVTQNPNLLNNPYTLPAFSIGMQVAERAANSAEKMAMYRMQYGPRTVVVDENVTQQSTRVPSIAEASDPNFVPPSVSTTTGGGGDMRATLLPEQEKIDAENYSNMPTRDFVSTVGEMDMRGGEQGFGFGWSLDRGFNPGEENIKEFQQNFSEYNSASPEEQQKIEEQNRLPAAEAGENAFPLKTQLFPDIVGVVGPKGSPSVEKIEENLTPGKESITRSIVIKDPTTKFINDLQLADKVVSGDNTLSRLHKDIGGKYDRVTTERLGENPDQKLDKYKIFVDGTEVPNAITSYDGSVAINFLRGMEAELATNKIKLSRSTEATAAGAPKERFPVKQQQAGATAAQQQATQPRQLTLEEEIAQATTAAQAGPTRTATKEQLSGVEKSRVAQSRSTLESEKRRLESSIYQVSRGTGQKSLKRGITKQLEDRVKERIAQIDKELEGLK